MTAPPTSQSYDVAIVGGGPAGLTAALWLGRYLHSVVVIDSGDPRNWETRAINGFTGRPSIRPAELRGDTRDECRRYGAELVDGFVARVRRADGDTFAIDYDPIELTKAEADAPGPGAPRSPADNDRRSETRTLLARRLLLAFGIKDEWPKVPGLRQVYGSTAHVCPDCDGFETRGKRVLVIASGRKAAGMALDLTTWTGHIVICTNGVPASLADDERARLDALGIPVIEARIARIHQNDSEVQSVELEGGRSIQVDEIFFAIAQRPADDLGTQLGCERDEQGQIVVDDRGHTSVRNAFAAGDIVPGPQLAIVAAAEGAVAALAIHRSLVPDERKL